MTGPASDEGDLILDADGEVWAVVNDGLAVRSDDDTVYEQPAADLPQPVIVISIAKARGALRAAASHYDDVCLPRHLPYVMVDDPALWADIERLRQDTSERGKMLRAREDAPLWKRALFGW